MIKNLFFACLCVLIFASGIFAQSQGSLQGKIIDAQTREPIPFANIVIEASGRQVAGTSSDFNGNYRISPITPGRYDLKTSSVGYQPVMVTGVLISPDQITFKNVNLEPTAEILTEFVVTEYAVPLISKDQTTSGGTMTSEEIQKMPGRSAESVAVTVGGVFSADGEMGSIRGAREEGTVTYIDGVRVRGSSGIPQAAIDQVTVMTGGLPAQYGDATGGVVNITTRGPAREFGGGIEFLTSELTDKYGYNLLGFSVQGPLIKGKNESSQGSLLGFFISGELSTVKDGRPSAIGTWKINDEKLTYLEENPLRPSGLGYGSYQNSEFVRMEDLEQIKARQNIRNNGINLSGKIDVRTAPNTMLTFGGSIDYNYGRSWVYSYSLYNYKNNPQVIDNTWRVYGRFSQRFPATDSTKSLIRNISYSIQADYSKYYQTVQNENHKDNLFNYGYVGKFTTHKIKSYELGSDTILGYSDVYIHNGFADTLYEYERSEINPELANYTTQYYGLYDETYPHYYNSTLVQNGGALLNGQNPYSVYAGLWSNTGTQYNSYSVFNGTQIGINASAGADIKNHNIQLGFQYEQRIDRSYAYSPVGLWTLMRGLTNSHIEQLDKNNPIGVYDAYGFFQDTIYYNRLYDGESQSFFDKNLRELLGLDVEGTDWIDLDSYSPDLFSIDMFSADELFNQGFNLVTYYGYDHTGKLLKNKPSFDDFFTAKDENGNYTRYIAPFEPIYMAGYIQDKFSFEDLIFNIGIRVDRFDANQSVLKDPFLFFESKTLKEVNDLGPHPSNMGDDYYVYVNDLRNPSRIVGYRDGYVWYNAEGTEIQDPSVLQTASGIAPYLVNSEQETINSKAFKDYEPQISVMPRISFSFPISDEALFLAHYDVLTKRPTTGLRMDPINYYFIRTMGQNFVSNPALKPEKTIDYELGFQQKISNASALKISGYYRELRDLVQAYRYSEAYPNTYYSYNNIDFGTVKGATISYDLRKTNNIWVKANYTIQFADGTGSTATSGVSLVQSGQPNLRTTSPLSYDRRHAIATVVDFRFGNGSEYNGPVITRVVKGTDMVKTIPILENTGANIQITGGSGTPYSRQSNITADALGGGRTLLKGSVNSSRLPWSFRVDARIDRDIEIKFGEDAEGNKTKTANQNVYLQILNVLNTKNIMSVYRATGVPDDDGYLAAAEFQAGIESQIDPQSFRDLYSVAVNYPYNYSLPRLIRIGVSLNF
ncbi:MAG: TonB-dependent receptor [Bacteroidales bacterium]|nr:TonB-dependent receptor [Bacteroidales bacterium]